jgi:hypothetical protein
MHVVAGFSPRLDFRRKTRAEARDYVMACGFV